MNYMAKVAEMLGVELGERFKITDDNRKYWLDERGINCEGYDRAQTHGILEYILTDRVEIVKPPWKPKVGEEYYTVDTDGSITSLDWYGYRYDIMHYAFGNCFRTEAEAEAHKGEILQKMKEVLEG